MKLFIVIALCSTLYASDYSFVTPERHVHIEGNYRPVAEAHVKKGGHLLYADSSDSLFLSHFLNCDNALSWQLGYNYMKIDWNKNPSFSQTNFNYAKASLGYITTSMEGWRWILNGGATVDATTFNFGKSGVYSGFFWGRYHFNNCLGVHAGLYGYAGVRNAYTLPILGVDWRIGERWQLNAIFPIDFSLEYFFAKNWSSEISYASFGGPYRIPWRTHNGHILEVHSTGVEWDLNYDCNQRYNSDPCDKWFNASIGLGWNFGGWLLIKDEHNHHGKYYHYDSAPYAQVEAALNF